MAEVVVTPLVQREHPCGRGPWYDGQPSGRFDFFVVDGPPLRDGGRVAAFPALAAHRRDDWEFWLFDADRPDEQRSLAAWSQRFRFEQSVQRIDDTGVAVLGPPGAVPAQPPVVRGLGISILAGGRPKLLARTLESFAARWGEQTRAAHVCAFVNGRDHESHAVISAAGWVDRTISYGPDVVPVGLATSLVVGAVAARPDVELVLHLEDDWETRTMDADALVRAAEVLRTDPTVGQVRLRHRSEQCLTRHLLTGHPIVWREDGARLRADAHFTFNPALIRADLIDRVFPVGDERHAQRRFLETGLEVVQLRPGVFTHCGAGNSRRRALDARTGIARTRR